jgi:hypothetical protein
MKKVFLLFLFAATIGLLAGCAVKSDLEKVEGYPRNYPVY